MNARERYMRWYLADRRSYSGASEELAASRSGGPTRSIAGNDGSRSWAEVDYRSRSIEVDEVDEEAVTAATQQLIRGLRALARGP